MNKAVVPDEGQNSLEENNILRQRIGSRLQTLYSDTSDSAIPDEMSHLLDELEAEAGVEHDTPD